MNNKLEPIDQEWVKTYIDEYLKIAQKLDEKSPLRAAVLLRVDHVMDLVKAWRNRGK